jgi:putative MATE family efflux protein
MAADVLQHRQLMVSGSIDRAILHLGAPAALSALLQAGFLVVDAFWLGRVGPVALAAASTAGFMMWLAQTLGDGMAMGSGSVLAQAVGSGDREAARRASAAGQFLALWGSLLVSILGLMLGDRVFHFMGTAADVSTSGMTYLRIILVAMPAYFLFVWISAAFRAVGDARTPLWLLGIAAIVNVVIDPLLIFGLGPVPALGVTGAALATAASWLTGTVVGWMRLGRLGLRPGLGTLFRPPSISLTALRVGLPLGLEGALFSVIYILLTRQTTGFGTAAVAALGVGHKLEMFNYFICAGMGAAATTLVGQSLGAGDTARAARAVWRTLFLTILPVGMVTALLVLHPRGSVALFISDPEVVTAGFTYVLLVGMSQVFMAFEVILLGGFAGFQWTTIPAVSEVILTAARIPVAAVLISAGIGVESVWLAIAVTTAVKGLLLAALFASRHGRGRGGHRGRDALLPP